jgi:hypothetical protein
MLNFIKTVNHSRYKVSIDFFPRLKLYIRHIYHLITDFPKITIVLATVPGGIVLILAKGQSDVATAGHCVWVI